MEGISLKSRAIAFAVCVGATAFILAMLATGEIGNGQSGLARAVVVALICAVMSWASAESSVAGIADSIDAVSERIVAAAQGDLTSPVPKVVAVSLPELSTALDALFNQVRANIESVHALAMFDPVTSLANRTNFRREADRLLQTMGDAAESALFFIDLDNFKAVNDTYGHAQGDQLLGMVANRLRVVAGAEASRTPNHAAPLVGRLAGDEFTILFPQVAGMVGTTRLAHALLAALTEPFDLAGHSLDVGASIGVALRPSAGQSLTTLMRAADVAMYHAKASGRGQFQFYSDALAERLADRSRLEIELRDAVQRAEFAIVLQPQVSLTDGALVAAEALLRWDHPVDGLRAPETFIAAAEESGLIFDIGDWSVDAAADIAADWARRGVAHRLAVNLSPRQINRPDFFLRLRAALKNRQVSPAMLEIEVSEAVAMGCGDALIAEIAALRVEGARVVLDNFGIGLSSLSRLRDLPIDRVKIDGALIREITTQGDVRLIVQSMIGLARGLGYETVADGVEDIDTVDILRVMGCDAAQGHAIAHPMTHAEFLAWSNVARRALAS